MKRRLRCQICDELFSADPRVGKRQRACGGAACQRERHPHACSTSRQREGPTNEDERLRRRFGTPEQELWLDVVRDECGVKIQVVL